MRVMGVGLDGLARAAMAAACNAAIKAVMRRGRAAYVLILCAEGTLAGAAREWRNLRPEQAYGFAEALEAEAAMLREYHRLGRAPPEMGNG